MAPGTGITFLPPTETLGAGCEREDIAWRFLVDDLINPILQDNNVQDFQLREDIEKHRLEHWYAVIQEEAKKMVEEEARENAAEDAAAKELSQELADKEEKKAVTVGNGELVQVRSHEAANEDGHGEGDDDQDGDVDMS